METLTYTLEKACVLATLMFVLGRTGWVAQLAASPHATARAQPALALAFFVLMAVTEFWIAAYQQTLLNARIIATCAAGLLCGPWLGMAVGLVAGALAVVLARASLPGYGLP